MRRPQNPGAWFQHYLCTCLREGEGGERRGRDEPDKILLGFGNEENMWSR